MVVPYRCVVCLVDQFFQCITAQKTEFLKFTSDLQMQIEAWFKSEFLFFLRGGGIQITSKNREVPVVVGGKEEDRHNARIEQ